MITEYPPGTTDVKILSDVSPESTVSDRVIDDLLEGILRELKINNAYNAILHNENLTEEDLEV